MAFAGERLSSTETQYRNTERKTLDMLHSLQKCHHYCFAREVHISTDHYPLVSVYIKHSSNPITDATVKPTEDTQAKYL